MIGSAAAPIAPQIAPDPTALPAALSTAKRPLNAAVMGTTRNKKEPFAIAINPHAKTQAFVITMKTIFKSNRRRFISAAFTV